MPYSVPKALLSCPALFIIFLASFGHLWIAPASGPVACSFPSLKGHRTTPEHPLDTRKEASSHLILSDASSFSSAAFTALPAPSPLQAFPAIALAFLRA